MFKKTFFSLLFVLLFSTLHAEETWKITSLDWQPYSGADMTSQGNSVQKLREALAKEGIKLVVEFYPWLRAQKQASEKDYVGYFPAWPEEVAEGFTASPAIDWSEVGLLKRTEDKITYTNLEDLFKNHKVGIVKTYTYPKEISSLADKYTNNTIQTSDETSLLKMLSAGRFDIGITDPTVMLYMAQKEGVSNVESMNVTIVKKELVIAFRNGEDNKKRVELINKLFK